MSKYLKSCLLFWTACIVISCASPEIANKPQDSQQEKLPVEKQQELAMAKFEEMLELTVGVDRFTVIDELKNGYETIIKNYPDASLAEESYYRLIIMELEMYVPPHIDEAERLYREYFKKYPKPTLEYAINDAMIRFYNFSQNWEKLAAFTTPAAREYVKTNELKVPHFMFYYSEAKFNLHDLAEARKGFKIVIHHFPNSREASLAKERLKQIEKMMENK